MEEIAIPLKCISTFPLTLNTKICNDYKIHIFKYIRLLKKEWGLKEVKLCRGDKLSEMSWCSAIICVISGDTLPNCATKAGPRQLSLDTFCLFSLPILLWVRRSDSMLHPGIGLLRETEKPTKILVVTQGWSYILSTPGA